MKSSTEDPYYNDSVCYQRFCCKIEFAVLKKLDIDPSTAGEAILTIIQNVCFPKE